MPKIRTAAPTGRAPRTDRVHAPRAAERAPRAAERAPRAALRALGAALVPALLLVLLPVLLLGCQTAPESRVPVRTDARSSLLAPTMADRPDPILAARNDDRLGTRRDAFVRLPVAVESATLDRQWILNGRPFDRFRTTTVTRERLVR